LLRIKATAAEEKSSIPLVVELLMNLLRGSTMISTGAFLDMGGKYKRNVIDDR
jgi:hypothetical protein